MACADTRSEPVGSASVSAAWLVFVIVASGFIYFIQSIVGLERIPVQNGARIIMVGLVAFAVANGSRSALGGGILAFAVTAFAVSALISTGLASSNTDVWSSFLFMYGNAILIPLFLVANIRLSRSRLLVIFCVAVTVFGAVQAVRQDLMLPDGFLVKFGIVFQDFVNGRVRVLGFFASAPRMAELLVLVAVYLQYPLIIGRRRNPVRFLLLLTVLFTLYNTYSRSGYVLWAVSLVVEMILVHRRRVQIAIRQPIVRALAVLSTLVGLVAIVTVQGLPSDGAVADSTSLNARFAHWGSVVGDLASQGFLPTAFGTGRSAHYSFLSPHYFVLDNLFLAILLYSGFVGLVCSLLLVVALLRRGLSMIDGSNAGRWIPILSLFVGLLPEGMFLDNHNTLFLAEFAILGMICDSSIRNSIERSKYRLIVSTRDQLRLHAARRESVADSSVHLGGTL